MSPYIQVKFFYMSHIYDKNKTSCVKDQCEKKMAASLRKKLTPKAEIIPWCLNKL